MSQEGNDNGPERKQRERSRVRRKPPGSSPNSRNPLAWPAVLKVLIWLIGGFALLASILTGLAGFTMAAGWGKVIVALAVIVQAGSIAAGLFRLARARETGPILAGTLIVLLVFALTFVVCGTGMGMGGGSGMVGGMERTSEGRSAMIDTTAL